LWLAYRAFVLKHLKSALVAITFLLRRGKSLSLQYCSLSCLKHCIALQMKNLLSKRKIAYYGLQIPPFVVVKIIVVAVANEAIARLAKQQQQMRDAVVNSPYHNTRFLPKSIF